LTKSHSINWMFTLIILGGIFATSCEEPVDLDIAVLPPQIVVNSNFAPGQPFQVSITKSKNVLSTETEEYINDAEVRIFSSQGKELDKLQLKHFQQPYYESRRLLPESGKVYRLEVKVPGYPQIIAEDIVPFPVALESIAMDTIETLGAIDERIYKVEINVGFTDPIGAQDYYHLSLYNHVLDPVDDQSPTNGFDETTSENNLVPLMPLENHKNNPPVTFHYEDGGILFTDEDFDGQKAGLKFYSLISLNNEAKMGKVVGVLRTVSKDYFLYHSSLSRQIANKDRPFVEPISVYSNIENGLGIFSGYTLYRDTVSITASF